MRVRPLPHVVPRKGEVLTLISAWWFTRTADLVAPHSAGIVLSTLVAYLVVYAGLLVSYIGVLMYMAQHPAKPTAETPQSPKAAMPVGGMPVRGVIVMCVMSHESLRSRRGTQYAGPGSVTTDGTAPSRRCARGWHAAARAA